MGNNEPVVVAEFDTAAEAELARHRLAEADIPSRLADEHLATLYAGYLTTAIGGVKVMVPGARAAEACRRLRALRPAPVPGLTRDAWIDRALFAAMFSAVFPGSVFFSLVMLDHARRAPGPWSRRSRDRALVALAANSVILGYWCIAVWLLATI